MIFEKHHVGDRVWEAFAYLDPSGEPQALIKPAVLDRTPDGRTLLRYEDGQAAAFYETSAMRLLGTREEAVLHCVNVLSGIRDRVGTAIERLLCNEKSPKTEGVVQ